MSKTRVVVGMSGGVDSSYAAYILQQQSFDVIGVMLTLWTEPSQEGENRCCSLDSQTVARQTANKLDIPFYVMDARELFRSIVVDHFIQGYSSGTTPNPCVLCNASVRWKMLLNAADMFSADLVSTGHYAQIFRDEVDGIHLYRGKDNSKDQSYVLSMLDSSFLQRTILPLGEMTKEEVRVESKQAGLPSHSLPDSQDLCFLGGMKYQEFIAKYTQIKANPGEIIDETGVVVGRHDGLAFYTLGQRKGLRIASATPYYVSAKDPNLNRLYVSHQLITEKKSFKVANINWINSPNNATFITEVQVRYKATAFPCTVDLDGNNAIVRSEENSSIIATPGQVAVFYKNNECLGGGIIV